MPLAWTGTGSLLLRAVASSVQAAYFLVTGKFSFRAMGVGEP
jgi:hypothetical protein